jgi:hypothetical protein
LVASTTSSARKGERKPFSRALAMSCGPGLRIALQQGLHEHLGQRLALVGGHGDEAPGQQAAVVGRRGSGRQDGLQLRGIGAGLAEAERQHRAARRHQLGGQRRPVGRRRGRAQPQLPRWPQEVQ